MPASSIRTSATAPAEAFLGVLWAGGSLALVWPLGQALALITTHHVVRGVGAVAMVVALRWALTTWVLERAHAYQVTRQGQGRRGVAYRLARRGLGHGRLLWAIDTSAERGQSEILRTAAGTATLALPLIFVTGGWECVAIVLILSGAVVPLYQRAGRRAAAADVVFRSLRGQLEARQLTFLRGVRELRGLGAVEQGVADITALSQREHRAALEAIRASLGSSLVTEFLAGVTVGLVAMCVGLGLLHHHETVAHAAVSILASAELVAWIRRYGLSFHQREAVAEAEALLATFESLPTTVVEDDHLFLTRDLSTVASPSPLTVTVDAGDRIALVGPSGVGKTTLIATLLGGQPPAHGTVTRTAAPIGHVSAASTLVPGTVRDNLTLGHSWPDETLLEGLTAVGLSLALDSQLTPDGHGLSSGEVIRLLIARALLHRCVALVLDDVSGLLDQSSRSALARALAALPHLAVLEATVDAPQLITPTQTWRLA